MCRLNDLLEQCGQLFLVMLLVVIDNPAAKAQIPSRVFTVPDDIGMSYFGDTVKFSPDDRLFLVETNRGRVDLKMPESTIRIYRVTDVQNYLAAHEAADNLAPVWTLSESTYKYGPIITNIRWLRDSSGMTFLAKSNSGNARLFLADIRSRKVLPLTPESQHVTGFDVRSEKNFVYAVLSPAIREKGLQDQQALYTVGTGRSLESLMIPSQALIPHFFYHDLSDLWAVVDGKRFRLIDPRTHRPVPLHLPGQLALALSPDGHAVITALTVEEVPTEWEKLYPPESPSSGERVRAGRQDPYSLTSPYAVSEYVLLDLRTGKTKSLTGAPVALAVGWLGVSHADWSADGKSVVLSSAFLAPINKETTQSNRPCIAVGDPVSGSFSCIDGPDSTVGTTASGREQFMGNAYFLHGDRNVVVDPYWEDESDWPISITYVRQRNGSWKVEDQGQDPSEVKRSIVVTVKEGINEPPVLAATDKKSHVSRTIWDPNPQLKQIKFGEVSVVQWKDKAGREWNGELYKPPDYVAGKRYPLVIQTHGFTPRNFSASGSYPTVFAAQELAGVGFLVLQVVENCPGMKDREGPCQVQGYESAAESLTRDGLADPDRVGLIGFSRTCYHVLETLTTSKFHFKAALIADGVTFTYMQYMAELDFNASQTIPRKAEEIMGAAPFGVGLNLWLERAPGFNMDKVTTPLEIVTAARGPLFMWEPYAALRYLHKPVDLLVMNTQEHVFTNPGERLISQGTSIDWFRFWLQDYEDPIPAKRDQYGRWRLLREERDAHK